MYWGDTRLVSKRRGEGKAGRLEMQCDVFRLLLCQPCWSCAPAGSQGSPVRLFGEAWASSVEAVAWRHVASAADTRFWQAHISPWAFPTLPKTKVLLGGGWRGGVVWFAVHFAIILLCHRQRRPDNRASSCSVHGNINRSQFSLRLAHLGTRNAAVSSAVITPLAGAWRWHKKMCWRSVWGRLRASGLCPLVWLAIVSGLEQSFNTLVCFFFAFCILLQCMCKTSRDAAVHVGLPISRHSTKRIYGSKRWGRQAGGSLQDRSEGSIALNGTCEANGEERRQSLGLWGRNRTSSPRRQCRRMAPPFHPG